MVIQNKEAYKVIIKEGVGEIIEKKSRFIATVKKVETEDEAFAFIDGLKKKYWDASHNCSAMVIGGQVKLTRCSDDGEPSGTAGRPILEVLLGENLCDVAVVVTRYFGGTLLGTGGLIRAYTQATKEGLLNCTIGCMRPGVQIKLVTDYNNIGKILYFLGEKNIVPENSEYTDSVCLYLLFPLEWKEEIIKELTEITAGKIDVEILQEINYVDKK